jgi:hypothetical membrane protein
MVGGGWGTAIAVSGAIAGFGGALVGVFPMDDLGLHAMAALTFFVASPVAIGMFTLWLWREQPIDVPRSLVVLGIVVVVIFAGFLVLLLGGERSLAAPTERADVWPVTILEWLTLVSVLCWFVAVAAVLWQREPGRRRRRPPPDDRPPDPPPDLPLH